MVRNVEKPYFMINGYNFRVDIDATSESEINLVENKMFVPSNLWGYTDIQWTNFSGETMDLKVYSRIYDEYTGEETQPDWGGIEDFYTIKRTPHAVLKYWGQNFVPLVIVTNLHAYENGTYIIKELKQKNLEYDFVETTLTLKLYEKPSEVNQTYWRPEESVNNVNTSYLSAQAIAVINLRYHTQSCDCNEFTSAENCTCVADSEVRLIQTLLQKWGYFPTFSRSTGSIEVNGKYCYYTTQAIMKFQEAEGIPVSGDFTEETKSKFLKKVTEE